ncbi:MAG TPA: carbohydrate porin, partial [Vicinamibacterales bacterium]|nr:carbohydrate porin [Vicinamibacterales bacterium]
VETMGQRSRISVHVLSAMLFFSATARPALGQSSVPAAPPDPAIVHAQQEPGAPQPGELGFRFNGYLRAGFGVDGDGKGQQPFQAPLAGAKYRLGNEAETYLETTFSYGAKSEDDKPAYFDTRVRIAYVTPTSQTSTFDTTFSLREAYAVARRVWESQPTATFWAGARFYDRQDVHMNDFYYRDPSGFGGGVEDVALGERVKLAAAWIGGTQDELESSGVPAPDRFRFNKNTVDVRLYDMRLGPTRASVAVDLSYFAGDDDRSGVQPITIGNSFGASTTGILELPFTDGRNKVAVQYGKGAAYDFRSVVQRPIGRTFQPGEQVDIDDLWQFRLVNDFLLDQRGPWSLQAVAVYQELDNGAASDSRIRWVSLGARPVRRLGRFFSMAVEAGWDHTEQGDLPGGSLVKLTVAPQITPALKFLSRPSLRAFATWAHWSDSFRGQIAAATDPTAVRGTAVGVQMEAWW